MIEWKDEQDEPTGYSGVDRQRDEDVFWFTLACGMMIGLAFWAIGELLK